MNRRLRARGSALLCAAVLLAVARPGSAAPTCPTVAVLEFERVGTDGRLDWLVRGLPDLVAMTFGRACLERIEPPGEPVEPRLSRGVVPGGSGGSGGSGDRRPAADFLLLGSFFVDGEQIVVESLLRRSSDERLFAVADVRGPVAEVLSMPALLTRTMLGQLGLPFDDRLLTELAREAPRGMAAASAFYRGLAARDAGDHGEALARFLECARLEAGFIRARREAFRMHLLRGDERAAAEFALETARQLEEADLAHALEFLHLASQKAIAPTGTAGSAAGLLERIDRLAQRHEEATGEAAALKRRLLEQVLALSDGSPADGPALLSRAADHLRIWTRAIPDELESRQRSGGSAWVGRDGTWVREPVPEPTVAMWRIRALLDLARLHAREGRIEAALERYRGIVEDYAFLEPTGLFDEGSGFFWTEGLRLEAHFMIVRHLGETGRLVRDPFLQPHLNEAAEGEAFLRDFADPAPDPRARVHSRRDDGGHEYFDFAAPQGRAIRRVRFESQVEGPAWLSVDLPDAKGWPPQFSFSRRLEHRRLPGGRAETTIEIPGGTALLSLSVLWGPRWAVSLADAFASLRAPRDGKPTLSWWKASFELQLAPTGPEPPGGATTSRVREADDRLIEHYASRWGWEEGIVLRRGSALQSRPGGADGSRDPAAFSADGAILLAAPADQLVQGVPPSIDTEGREHSPLLVHTHEGEHALLWSRGPSGASGERFVARSGDLVSWRPPMRISLATEMPDGYPAPPLAAGTEPILPVPGGYLMLLEGGWTRFSPDLARWAPPKRTFEADGRWIAAVRTADGRLWAVLTRSDDREPAPGEKPDPHVGFWRDSAGRTFLKGDAIQVSTSLDGVTWSPLRTVHAGREASGLWALPLPGGGIAIAVGYGSLELRLLRGDDPERFRPVDSSVRLPMAAPEAVFFVGDGRLWCGRVVDDFVNQEQVVLFSGSAVLYRGLTEDRP